MDDAAGGGGEGAAGPGICFVGLDKYTPIASMLREREAGGAAGRVTLLYTPWSIHTPVIYRRYNNNTTYYCNVYTTLVTQPV